MSDVIIQSHNDGPYHVKGAFKIVTDGGREITARKTYCRIGSVLGPVAPTQSSSRDGARPERCACPPG
jgi:hypothetical protein